MFLFLNNFEIPCQFSCKNLDAKIRRITLESVRYVFLPANLFLMVRIYKKTISNRSSTVLRLLSRRCISFYLKIPGIEFKRNTKHFYPSLNSDDVILMSFLEKGRSNLEDQIRGNEKLPPYVE